MSNNSTRYIGTHVDKEFHRKLKIKCAELDMSVGEAIVSGLILLLELEDSCEDKLISATGS